MCVVCLWFPNGNSMWWTLWLKVMWLQFELMIRIALLAFFNVGHKNRLLPLYIYLDIYEYHQINVRYLPMDKRPFFFFYKFQYSKYQSQRSWTIEELSTLGLLLISFFLTSIRNQMKFFELLYQILGGIIYILTKIGCFAL